MADHDWRHMGNLRTKMSAVDVMWVYFSLFSFLNELFSIASDSPVMLAFQAACGCRDSPYDASRRRLLFVLQRKLQRHQHRY